MKSIIDKNRDLPQWNSNYVRRLKDYATGRKLKASWLMAVGVWSVGRRSHRQPHVLLYNILFINLRERACFFDRLMSYIIAKGVS